MSYQTGIKFKNMGRHSTGAWTTSESQKIDLSFLLRNGYIKKGGKHTGWMGWTDSWWGKDTGSITIESCYTEEDKYIRLIYTSTDLDGNKQDQDYKIRLTTRPSNLGKGEVLYFICPRTGRLCRILYNAYYYGKFMSRYGYNYRLYYPGQISSQYSRYNEIYWTLDHQLKKLYKQRRTSTYNGKITRRAQRILTKEDKMERADYLRWSPLSMPHSIRKLIY